jgi:N6-adenosine-specific RNA methylase IME4
MPEQHPTTSAQVKFPVIYADPPWSRSQKGNLGAIHKYDLMTTDQIKDMAEAVAALADDDAVLLLWVTNNGLPDGLEVMKAWGFRYVTNAVWDKYYMGIGNYFRGSHELLLMGIRGKAPTFKFRGQRSTLHFPRKAHSVKPAEMYPMLEALLDGPYCELFARARPNSRSNWAIWGNEVDSDLSLLEWGYPVPSDFARQGTDGERSL